MIDCKPMSTPIDPNVRLQEVEGKDLEDVTMYRQLVGRLIYLTLTLPNIFLSSGSGQSIHEQSKEVSP